MQKIRYILFSITVICVMAFGLSACSSSEGEAVQAEAVTGSVIEIEDFGHARLDITVEAFTDAGYELGDVVTVTFEDYEADMPYFDGYYSEPGEPMVRAYPGDVNIAICINYGDFSEETGIEAGDEVAIALKEKAGALQEQEISALSYSNDRADYESDVVFANFRPVTIAGIGEDKVYRSASPINNIYNRAGITDDLIEDAGVRTVMDMADSSEEIEAIFTSDDFDSPYYKTLYENGQVIALDMSVNFYSEEFQQEIAAGFAFLAEGETPYLIHCNEGKDRTGFAMMLIEALMGADLDEIKDDYMISYDNYYGITETSDPEKYNAILDKNLLKMLFEMTGLEEGVSLESVDLSEAAAQYLMDGGMTQEQVELLKEKLM